MTEKASAIINDAFGLLGVREEETALKAEEYAIGVRILNRMMHEFTIDGINLGFTEIVNPSDEMTVPASTIGCVIANLATELFPHFPGEETSQAIFALAVKGKSKLIKLTTVIGESSYPSTMPTGSGNDTFSNRRFYPGQDTGVTAETNGPILVEDET